MDVKKTIDNLEIIPAILCSIVLGIIFFPICGVLFINIYADYKFMNSKSSFGIKYNNVNIPENIQNSCDRSYYQKICYQKNKILSISQFKNIVMLQYSIQIIFSICLCVISIYLWQYIGANIALIFLKIIFEIIEIGYYVALLYRILILN